jgi:chromosome segregation protein
VGSELAAVNQFLRTASVVGGAVDGKYGDGASGDDAPRALSEALRVEPGYELALAAALGGRLDAVLVPDLAGAAALLDRAGPDGATALLAETGMLAERGMLAEGECPPASVEGECPPAPVSSVRSASSS